MSTKPEAKNEIYNLFRKNVPEVADGSVEILDVARSCGHRACVAVRSHSTQIDPVGACTGPRGARIQAMVQELAGEHLTVIRWDESPSRFIQNAFGGHPEVVLDDSTRTAHVTLIEPNPHAPDASLVGELAGWDVRLRNQRGE